MFPLAQRVLCVRSTASALISAAAICNNNLRLLRLRQTAQPTMVTACHAGQQQQCLARGVMAAKIQRRLVANSPIR